MNYKTKALVFTTIGFTSFVVLGIELITRKSLYIIVPMAFLVINGLFFGGVFARHMAEQKEKALRK